MFGRVIACAIFLLAAASARAQEIPNFSRVMLCKAIKDDAERLRCFDRALSAAPADPTAQTTKEASTWVEGEWRVSEGKSSTEDSPRLAAVLEAVGGVAALIVRCQDIRTDVYVTVRTYIGSAEPLPVTYTIDGSAEVATRWLPAREGNAVFAPTPTLAIAFIRSLADQATLVIKIRDFQGRRDEFTFHLGPIADVRARIAEFCKWPAEHTTATAPVPPQGSPPQSTTAQGLAPQIAAPQRAGPQRAVPRGKVVSVPHGRQRWDVSARHPQRN